MRKTAIAMAALLALATAASAADTIKLGGMLPLSGRASDLGVTCKQGAELAVKEINAKGGVLGKKLELLMADSKANVQELVSLSKRYIQKDQVNFLFGVVSSGGSLAVAEVAKQEKVIFMDTVGSTDTLTKEKWNRYSFRSGTCNSQEANSLALYAASKHKNLTKFYNIGPDYEYGRTMWEPLPGEDEGSEPEGAVRRGAVAEALHSGLHLLHQRHPPGEARCRVLSPSGAATWSPSSSRRSRTACSTR